MSIVYLSNNVLINRKLKVGKMNESKLQKLLEITGKMLEEISMHSVSVLLFYKNKINNKYKYENIIK